MPTRKRPEPQSRGPIWLRYYVSQSCQLIFLAGVTAILIGTYFILHVAIKPFYKEEAAPIYQSALRLYRIGQDEETNKLVVLYRGTRIDTIDSTVLATPMDAGKQVAVQGVIERFVGGLHEINSLSQAYIWRVLGRVSETSGEMHRIDLANLVNQNNNSESQETQTSDAASEPAWIILDDNDLDLIELLVRHGAFNSAGNLLKSKNVHYAKQLPVEAFSSSVNKTLNDYVAEVLEQSESISSDFAGTRPMHQRERDAVDREMRACEESFNADINMVFSKISFDSSDEKKNVVDPEPNRLLPYINELLSKELLDVSFRETGHFWLVGKYKWLELVFWTLFGVITQSLIQQGAFLVGARKGEIWQPSELLRQLSKLCYAPLITVAIFLGIGYLGETRELNEFANASLAPLMFAFIIGMYPNTIYRIMKRVTDSFFSPEVTKTTRREPTPEKKKLVLEQKPKTIQELANSLKQTVKAPLENETQPS